MAKITRVQLADAYQNAYLRSDEKKSLDEIKKAFLAGWTARGRIDIDLCLSKYHVSDKMISEMIELDE